MIERTLAFALCAAVGAAASAPPFSGERSSTPVPGPVAGGGAGVDSVQVVDEDFEAYSVGQGVSTMGDWEIWPGGTQDAIVSDAFASSGTKSSDWSFTGADVIQVFSGLTSGQYTLSVNTYVPTGSAGSYYIIGINTWGGTGTAADTMWSLQVHFNTLLGEILPDCAGCGAFASIINDEWVEFRAEIDLDADTYDMYYDDVLLAEDICWSCGVFGGELGATEIAVLDLFTLSSSGPNEFYMDDVLLEESTGCYADCDGSGGLDFFDFLCFQNAFAAMDPYADCDTSGGHDFFDFLCFQNAFAAGCI